MEKLSSSHFWDVQSLEHKDLFQANKADFMVKPQVAPWRLRLIGTIYQHTPANSDKYMLFSLFLITTICNEERMYLWIYIQGQSGREETGEFGESVSNGMNNLPFFVEFFHAGRRWIEVIVSPAKQIAAVNRPIQKGKCFGSKAKKCSQLENRNYTFWYHSLQMLSLIYNNLIGCWNIWRPHDKALINKYSNRVWF